MSDAEYKQHTNIWQKGALYNPPRDKSDISTHCISYIQYRAEPKQDEAGVVEGPIRFSTQTKSLRVVDGWHNLCVRQSTY